MRHPAHGRLPPQIASLRREFLQDGRLPFSDVLSERAIAGAMREITAPWKDRIFSPLVTLWVFFSQVRSADQSCRAAVARLIAHRVARGLEPCSSETGGYCQARGRLPERFFSAVARLVGRRLDERVDARWLWKGRRVGLFDGSMASTPDTAANRMGISVDLQPGPRDELRAGPDRGDPLAVVRGDPRAGHLPLRRQGPGGGQPAGIGRGAVDPVSRLSAHRTADFRKGARPGQDDHLVIWKKSTSICSVDRATYRSRPESIVVREARFRVDQPEFRTRVIVVVTTLLDPEQGSREELAELYRARWNNELDLRSIKITLQMDMLRCKTPELVRKEIWAHVLAYNLLRTVMAWAAAGAGVAPRTISFQATLQVLEAFRPLIAERAHRGAAHRAALSEQVLLAIAVHRVADRPDRFEPRRARNPTSPGMPRRSPPLLSRGRNGPRHS